MLVTGDYREAMQRMGFELSDRAQFIGEEIDGKLVSMAAFDNFDEVNIDVHIIAKRITRRWIRAICEYAFEMCGCRRMTSLNDSDNFQMKPYLERLGFEYEGTLRHGLPDSDLVIYGMIREDCKWVNQTPAE